MTKRFINIRNLLLNIKFAYNHFYRSYIDIVLKRNKNGKYFDIEELPIDIDFLFSCLHQAYPNITKDIPLKLEELQTPFLMLKDDKDYYHISSSTYYHSNSSVPEAEFIFSTNDKGTITDLVIKLSIKDHFSLKILDDLSLPKLDNYPTMIILYFDKDIKFHRYTIQNSLMTLYPNDPSDPDEFYALDTYIEIYPDKKNIMIEANFYRENEQLNKMVKENVDDEIIYNTILFTELFFKLNRINVKEVFDLPNRFDAQNSEELMSFCKDFIQSDKNIVDNKVSLFKILSC